SESVSAALAAGFYAQNVQQAAHLCANMGGDTDTIGSMACAIIGARDGLKSFDPETVDFLQQTNNINFTDLALRILSARESFKAE
ncbi:MAG: ADP-ribosylglycohydrolase family protein, partial [Proteobacteria bacterium]|nr:ADP-ribosylglycohydrolase family protein [Candidatus Avisuccinivibrio stercorigallinarum]